MNILSTKEQSKGSKQKQRVVPILCLSINNKNTYIVPSLMIPLRYKSFRAIITCLGIPLKETYDKENIRVRARQRRVFDLSCNENSH